MDNELTDLRHIDIKIEYYRTKAMTGKLNINDTIALGKYKILRELFKLLEIIEANSNGNLELGKLRLMGGIDGIKKQADTLKSMMSTLNEEEDRLNIDRESEGVIIKFNEGLKIVNNNLSKIG